MARGTKAKKAPRRFAKRKIVSVVPPLPERDHDSLTDLMRKINSGASTFRGTRFMHRGSVVTVSPREEE